MNGRYAALFALAILCSVLVIPSEMTDAEKQDLTILDIRYDADVGYVVVVVDSEVDMMQFIVVIDGSVSPVAALGAYTGTENWILIYHTISDTPEDFVLKNVDEIYSDLHFTYPPQEPSGPTDSGDSTLMYVGIAVVVVLIIIAAILVLRRRGA